MDDTNITMEEYIRLEEEKAQNMGKCLTRKLLRGQARVVKCYNYQGEGHMARQCTQLKRPRNVAWFKEKAMLAKAQEAGQILDEKQLAFLADLGTLDSQAAQTTIPNTIAFQTEDLDACNSNCDDVSNAKAVLMANIYMYGSNVVSENRMPKIYNLYTNLVDYTDMALPPRDLRHRCLTPPSDATGDEPVA
nr:hypothetical protein [Tanacetum cinerariifolium]